MTKLAKAANGFLVVNGRRVYAATSFGLDVESIWSEEFGLDEKLPVEFSPSIQRVFGEIGLIRVVGDGGPEGAGMGGPLPVSQRTQYATIQFEDRSGVTLWSCEGMVVFVKQSWRTASKGLQVGSITWKAAGIFTEGSGA
jgi:hypothetical protein